jgi:hypothetical protein
VKLLQIVCCSCAVRLAKENKYKGKFGTCSLEEIFNHNMRRLQGKKNNEPAKESVDLVQIVWLDVNSKGKERGRLHQGWKKEFKGKFAGGDARGA